MSRIGRKPIVIPAGVTVTVDEAAHTVAVKGPKGSLNSNYHPLMTVKVEGNEVLVTRPNDEPKARSLHGLTRTNIANLVNGVVNGHEKKLEIVGVGMRCQKQGSNLVMNLGFSHQVTIPDTEDCTIVVTLKYQANGEPVIAGLRRVSKPGLRIYTNCEDMPKVMKGLGTAIISTSKGIMTDKAARAEHVGGEVLAYVW